jgi:hypothetical protein
MGAALQTGMRIRIPQIVFPRSLTRELLAIVTLAGFATVSLVSPLAHLMGHARDSRNSVPEVLDGRFASPGEVAVGVTGRFEADPGCPFCATSGPAGVRAIQATPAFLAEGTSVPLERSSVLFRAPRRLVARAPPRDIVLS